jgi:prepilin-type N-terminal cleavage/methylation domain-containing protein
MVRHTDQLAIRRSVSTPKRRLGDRGGLTLLEVMLALAILGVCMAALGGLIHVGAVSASRARDEAKAQILCETTMAEVAAGILPAQPIGPVPYELETEWAYTITIMPIQQQELTAVSVRVEQLNTAGQDILDPYLASFELVRWIAQPQAIVEETTEESSESTDSQQGSSGQSSGGTPSGGSSSPNAPAGGS